ncbi:MAG: cytochrome c3 family protein [Acidobacteria bacterium]|nr:cytochrome c3 family protein [Acidobacteriota bacterium]
MKPRGEQGTAHARFARGRARGGGARSRASLFALAAFAAFALGSAFAGGRAADPRAGLAGARATSPAAAARSQGGNDFSRFAHNSPRHASLACAACHERRDNSTRPRLPGHKACTGCHLPQFVTTNAPMCAICHTDLDGQDPPVKNFPALASFNARFDHAQHNAGAARPAAGCAACHRPVSRSPAALTIPAGLGAHAQCYSCHAPGSQSAGRDIASCGVCHAQARYARTPVNRAAFAASFSHSAHGPRQNLRCDNCHQLRPGLAQSRQVTAPRVAQHFQPGRAQSCVSCHNDRRGAGGRVVFGDADFNNCRLCHKRQNFRMGP